MQVIIPDHLKDDDDLERAFQWVSEELNIAAAVENALLNVKILPGLDTAAQRRQKQTCKGYKQAWKIF